MATLDALKLNEVHFGTETMETKWGDKAARRRDIVRAGHLLLRRNGLAALQMRDVAREAHVALGTVYTYFPTKEALYVAMYAERLDEMLAELGPTLESTTDFEELFVTVATSYRAVYAEYGKELDILSNQPGRERLGATASRVLLPLRKAVAEISPDDPDLALALLWSTVTGLADHFTGVRHELHRYTWDEAVNFAARTFVRGLAPERIGDPHG